MSGYNPTLKEAKAAFQEMLEAHVAEGAKDQEADYNLSIIGDFLSRMEAFKLELDIELEGRRKQEADSWARYKEATAVNSDKAEDLSKRAHMASGKTQGMERAGVLWVTIEKH